MDGRDIGWRVGYSVICWIGRVICCLSDDRGGDWAITYSLLLLSVVKRIGRSISLESLSRTLRMMTGNLDLDGRQHINFIVNNSIL